MAVNVLMWWQLCGCGGNLWLWWHLCGSCVMVVVAGVWLWWPLNVCDERSICSCCDSCVGVVFVLSM